MLSDIEELQLDFSEEPDVMVIASESCQPQMIHPPQHLLQQIGTNNEGKGVINVSGNKARSAVAFRTESAADILDDGYRWRKYGKKMVKNSPHPRNYYRCCSEGCNVKKRIEREREDSRIVITTYVGVHNHHPPFTCNSLRARPASII